MLNEPAKYCVGVNIKVSMFPKCKILLMPNG